MADLGNSKKEIEETNDSLLKILNRKFEILASQIRLSIMLILNSQKKVKVTDFAHLFSISSGKLDHHLKMLEKAKLITKKNEIFPNRARVVISITKIGETLLEEYFIALKEILKENFG